MQYWPEASLLIIGTKCFSTSPPGRDSETERIDSTALSLTTVSSTVAKFSSGGYSKIKFAQYMIFSFYPSVWADQNWVYAETVTWAREIYLICTYAWSQKAIGPRAYISGKSQLPMLQEICITSSTLKICQSPKPNARSLYIAMDACCDSGTQL